MINTLFLIIISFLIGVGITDQKHYNFFTKIDVKITEGMYKDIYNDDFKYGFNIGLIKCSGIIYDVKRNK